MSVSKNRVFGSLISLMVGTAVISLAAPAFAADGNIPVRNIAPLQAAPVSSSQQEALADASDVSELRAQLIKKEKELAELKNALSLQRKQIENATLYKDAQNRHGFKNLNIAQVDFELMKKQEDLERQARGLVQQQEWLEKERLRIQKLEQQVAGGNGAATTKDLTDAYQKMDSLEKRYQTEMAKLVKENREMQNRITELQNQKAVQTPVHLTTGSRNAADERLKAERKIIAIEKRHAAERDQLIADNQRMQEQITALQTAQKAEAEQVRSKAVTAEEKQQAEAHIRAMEKRHAAERAQLVAENTRMQEKMTALQQAQESAAGLAKEKTATEEERRRAEAKLAELQKQHEEERALLTANNRKLQAYLEKTEAEKAQEIAKLRTEMQREAAAKTAAGIASLKQQHEAEQQKLLEENRNMQARLAGLQQAQQQEAALAKSAAKTAEELAAAEQRAAALQKQHEEERLKLMRENLAMQERLSLLQQAQQQTALAAKQADKSVLAENERLEKELAALRTQHEAERRKLTRENAAVQQRLTAAEQEKQKLAQKTAAHIAEQETKYTAQLAAAQTAREKVDYVTNRIAARKSNLSPAAMMQIEPQAGGSEKPSLIVKEMSAEELAALERSYNPGATPAPAPHRSQNDWSNAALPAPVTTQAAQIQAQDGQYIPHFQPQAAADNIPENTITRPEPSISTHMPYGGANAAPVAAPKVAEDAAPDAYRNFLDGIMAVHRGESPSLDAPAPSSVIAEREKRAYEAAQAAAAMENMPQQQLSQTTIYAQHPVIQQQPPQYHDLNAASSHMPLQKQVIQAQPAQQQQIAPLPSYGSAAATEQPLSGLLKKSGIAPENSQLSDDGYLLKWSAGVANGLFEQQAWPQYKNANLRDLAASYVARYNQDCENKLKVLSDKAVGTTIQTVHTLCPVQGNNYEAVFVFYAVPQHSFSAIVHVAQPAYSRELQSLTAGLVPALQSLSGTPVKIDHIPAQLSHSQGTVVIQ